MYIRERFAAFPRLHSEATTAPVPAERVIDWRWLGAEQEDASKSECPLIDFAPWARPKTPRRESNGQR